MLDDISLSTGGQPAEALTYGDQIVAASGAILRVWQGGSGNIYLNLVSDPLIDTQWGAWGNTGIPAVLYSNPGLYETGGTVYLFYVNAGYGGTIKRRSSTIARLTANPADWDATVDVGVGVYSNSGAATLAPVDENEVYACYMSPDSSGARYITVKRVWYSGSWTSEVISYRWYGDNTHILTATGYDSVTNFDVVKSGERTIILVTAGIRGQSWLVYRQDGLYSDPVEVMPVEYGKFVGRRLSNIQGKLWLAGRVTRENAESYTAAWDSLLTSLDGENWTMDRNQLATVGDVRGKALLSGAYLYYAGLKSVYRAEATWLVDPASDPPDKKIVLGPETGELPDIVGWSLSVPQPGTAAQGNTTIRNGDEAYTVGAYASILRPGSQIIREAGYYGTSGPVYQQIGYESVDETPETIANGKRALSVISRDSVMKALRDWKATYYWQLMSQLKHYDDCDKLDNLYLMTEGKFLVADGKLVMDTPNREAIAFSTSPFETEDFLLKARVKDIRNLVSTTAVKFGLVGLATDEDNLVALKVALGSSNNITIEKKRKNDVTFSTSPADTTFTSNSVQSVSAWDLSTAKAEMKVKAENSVGTLVSLDPGANKVGVDSWEGGIPTDGSVATIYEEGYLYTVLATGSGTIDPGIDYDIMFSYRGGTFRAWWKAASSAAWTAVVWNETTTTAYIWDQADDPCLSDNGKGNVGIYAEIHPLYFRVEGFDEHVLAIPRNALKPDDFASMPSSGTVIVGAEKISYTGKSGNNMVGEYDTEAETSPGYNYKNPPDGNPAHAKDPDHDFPTGELVRLMGYVDPAWNGGVFHLWDNYMAIISDGKGKGLAWSIHETDGNSRWWSTFGEAHWADRGASDFFVTVDTEQATPSDAVGRGNFSRGYVVPSLYGATRGVAGTTAAAHVMGEEAFIEWDDRIQFSGFEAYDFRPDNNIEQLMRRVATWAGVTGFRFNSLYETASLALTASAGLWGAGAWLTGIDRMNLDLSFTLPQLAAGQKVSVMLHADVQDWATYTGLAVTIDQTSLLLVNFIAGSQVAIESFPLSQIPTGSISVRLVAQEEFITIFLDGIMAHVFYRALPTSPDQHTRTNYVGLNVYNAFITLSDVRIPELGEWRDGVDFDINTDGVSCLGKIIGDRAVRYFGDSLGRLRASVFDVREWAGSYGVEVLVNDRVQSDQGVMTHIRIECEDILEYIDPDAAQYGYAMTSLSMPGLTVAQAYEEAQRISRQAKEAASQRSLQAGAMLHWEAEDTVNVDYTASATGRVVLETIILSDLSYQFSPGGFSMKAGGRKSLGFQTPPPPPPAAPTNVAIVPGDTQVTITWD